MRLTARATLGFLILLLTVAPGFCDDVYLSLEEAPKAVFPEADSIEQRKVEVADELHRKLAEAVAPARPSIWEPFYLTYIARKQGKVIGYAVIAEEIGKHRPITFIVAVTPDGKVKDVAVMMYREAYGAEVRYPGFVKQFRGKDLEDPMRPQREIRNISGATLSVRAMSRGVRKALAVIELVYLRGTDK